MRPYLIGIGILLTLGAIAGVTYKLFFMPTMKTVFGRGARQVIVNSDTPKQRLMSLGCANLEIEAYWKKQRLFPSFNRANKSEESK